MRHISFPKIKSFENLIQDIKHKVYFDGLDENGEPIYNKDRELPIIKFIGTVKLDGTNSGVSYNNKDGVWIQSRKEIININKDNAGFAFFVESRKSNFENIIKEIANKEKIDLDRFNITVFGEFVGKGIQKGTAISQLENKSYFIFGVKVSKIDDDPDFNNYWLNYVDYKDVDNDIYNISDYSVYEINIDFNNLEEAKSKLEEKLEIVENNCPVGNCFGLEGVGEGIVWCGEFNDEKIRFKIKGEKHKVSRKKEKIPIDIEKVKSIKEFVEYSVTENRLEQAATEVFGDGVIVVEKLGDFLRWINNDIVIEEINVLKNNGLEKKDVNKGISDKAKEWFFNKMKNV